MPTLPSWYHFHLCGDTLVCAANQAPKLSWFLQPPDQSASQPTPHLGILASEVGGAKEPPPPALAKSGLSLLLELQFKISLIGLVSAVPY